MDFIAPARLAGISPFARAPHSQPSGVLPSHSSPPPPFHPVAPGKRGNMRHTNRVQINKCLGWPPTLKRRLGERDECERGQLTNFGAGGRAHRIDLYFAKRTCTRRPWVFDEFFTAHNQSLLWPSNYFCLLWMMQNKQRERWSRLIPYVRSSCIRKICGFQCFAFAKCCCFKYIPLFFCLFANILYSYVVNAKSRNESWQIAKCSLYK